MNHGPASGRGANRGSWGRWCAIRFEKCMSIHGALAGLFLIASIAPLSNPRQKVTIITGATIIDCAGGRPLVNGVVVIEGKTIKTVARQSEVRLPRDAHVIDAAGKFVMPGLIDMHVHFREWQGELFLAHGVTSVKDLGNPVEWISDLNQRQAGGRLRGPRIFFVGNNLDAPPPEGDHHVGVTGARDIEKAVELLRGFGAIAVKVRHKITPTQLSAITRVAHASGLPVTGHLARMTASEAVLAGIDGLEHATGVPAAAVDAPDQLKTDARGVQAFYEDLRGFGLMNRTKEAALIKFLSDKKVKLIPTLSIRRRAISDDSSRAMEEDRGYARNPSLGYVPEGVRRDWTEAALDKMIRTRFGREEMDTMRRGYERLEHFVRNFHRAAGLVLAGSDNLNSVPGLTLHRELESLVAAGLSPLEALMTATREAGRFLNRSDLGTIEPGKTADLLVLRANPLIQIGNLRSIEKVFMDGQEVDTRYHHDYALPPARPQLARPLVLERLLAAKQ